MTDDLVGYTGRKFQLNTTPDTNRFGQFIQTLVGDLLTAYGAVLFSGRKRTGILFLFATFLQPHHGFYGLLGALTAHLFAVAYRADRAYIRAGIFGASGLLTGLALSLYLEPSYSMLLLVPMSALFAAFLCAMLISWLGWKYGLPATALPFVFATWIGLLAARLVLGRMLTLEEPHTESYLPLFASMNSWLTDHLPNIADLFLRVIGATSLQTSTLAGVLILVGVLLGTRITALAMIGGAGIGMAFVTLFTGSQIGSHETALAAFNCVFAGGALGGVFVRPDGKGILFAILGTLLIGMLTVATLIHLRVLDLPPLAFPFAIGTLLLLWPFRMGLFQGVYLYPLANVGTAESNLRQYWRWVRKYGQASTSIRFTHFGKWTVTQGNDSLPTHTGVGRYGWDFMLLDSTDHSASYPCLSLNDYYGYGLPILAPAAGTIAAVVNWIPDNPPQQVETDNPYGNYVSIYHAPGEYSLLAHLQIGSVKVAVGQAVKTGQEIAKVGNSGRSPEPHLHIQMQNDWYPGAQSIPARWSGVLAMRQGKLCYIANGELNFGDNVSDYFSSNPTKLDDYFPFSVIGGEWQYLVTSGLSTKSIRLQVRPGLYGRFLLDDGEQVMTTTRMTGHWELDTLDETDYYYSGTGKRGLLALLSPAMSTLPLLFGEKYIWENEVHGFRLASAAKRLLELPGNGVARYEGYQLERHADGTKHLKLVVNVTTERKKEFRYELEFRSEVGLIHAIVMHGKHRVADVKCERYRSRLKEWNS